MGLLTDAAVIVTGAGGRRKQEHSPFLMMPSLDANAFISERAPSMRSIQMSQLNWPGVLFQIARLNSFSLRLLSARRGSNKCSNLETQSVQRSPRFQGCSKVKWKVGLGQEPNYTPQFHSEN